MTLKALKEAIDDAIYTYGNTLESEVSKAEMTEELEEWLQKSVEISLKLDEIVNA